MPVDHRRTRRNPAAARIDPAGSPGRVAVAHDGPRARNSAYDEFMADEMVEDLETAAVIAGGGPGGAMLGLLRARAGVDVLVLEKHADFLRDFRGDTIHPSTLRVLDELGLGAG